MFDWDTMDTNSKVVMMCLDWRLVKGVDPLSSLTLCQPNDYHCFLLSWHASWNMQFRMAKFI